MKDRILILRKVPFAICLLALFLLFVCFSGFTHNTGNILVWGFDWDEVESKPIWSILACEFFYESNGYPGFLGGIWICLLSVTIYFWRSQQSANFTRAAFITALIIGLCSFLIGNAVLFQISKDHGASEFLTMAFQYPEMDADYPLPPKSRFAIFYIPIVMATGLLFFPRTRKSPGSLTALFCSLPLVIFPFVLPRYLLHSYMCFALSGTFVTALNAFALIWLFLPSAFYLWWRKKREEN